MFNRLALYFIFSPSRTNLSSFFSPFLPTRALTAWTLFHPFALSLWKRWAQSVVPACLAWRAWHGGARRSDAQEPCCDTTLNVSQSKEWQAFELKHFNDASILYKKKFEFQQELRQIALWCRWDVSYYLWPFFTEQSFHSGRLEMKSRATFLLGARLPSLCSGDDAPLVSGRSTATPSKSFHFTPCSATLDPPIPKGASVNLCKVWPPHLPWYVPLFSRR